MANSFGVTVTSGLSLHRAPSAIEALGNTRIEIVAILLTITSYYYRSWKSPMHIYIEVDDLDAYWLSGFFFGALRSVDRDDL